MLFKNTLIVTFLALSHGVLSTSLTPPKNFTIQLCNSVDKTSELFVGDNGIVLSQRKPLWYLENGQLVSIDKRGGWPEEDYVQWGKDPKKGEEGSPQTFLVGYRKGTVPPPLKRGGYFSTEFEVDADMNLQWHNKAFVDKKNPNGDRAIWCTRFGRVYERLVALKYVDAKDEHCQKHQVTLKVAYV
ncbi:hypothetical protein L207DRAFT_568137 [Hyaloscypha variabilis F]|uniref:Uncharacterized protein n=1 Tax=Hyaloscypha variabilis (strain UAMH 11265 / GT02V1 / F) TaxID=1149755 RepID=A0A2J6RJ29_HYAVF|nr:hypothetical protein L207DRAFT_568137 [Hyaloscypha variabilis F]